MDVADAILIRPHAPGSGTFVIDDVTLGVGASSLFPNQITVRGSGGLTQESIGIFSIGQLSGSMVTGCHLIAGLDFAARAGDRAVLQFEQLQSGVGQTFTAVLGSGGPVIAGQNITGNYLVAVAARTLDAWSMICPAANQPSGQDLVVDVLKSTDHVNWTSLWSSTPNNRPKLTAGTNSNTGTVDSPSILKGDWLRFDVINAGGGGVQNVTLVLGS